MAQDIATKYSSYTLSGLADTPVENGEPIIPIAINTTAVSSADVVIEDGAGSTLFNLAGAVGIDIPFMAPNGLVVTASSAGVLNIQYRCSPGTTAATNLFYSEISASTEEFIIPPSGLQSDSLILYGVYLTPSGSSGADMSVVADDGTTTTTVFNLSATGIITTKFEAPVIVDGGCKIDMGSQDAHVTVLYGLSG